MGNPAHIRRPPVWTLGGDENEERNCPKGTDVRAAACGCEVLVRAPAAELTRRDSTFARRKVATR
jgi:hypothetical protein